MLLLDAIPLLEADTVGSLLSMIIMMIHCALFPGRQSVSKIHRTLPKGETYLTDAFLCVSQLLLMIEYRVQTPGSYPKKRWVFG